MLAATLEELRAVALADGSAAGYFPAMYARVTDRIRAGIADRRFADGERMERFTTTFAGWFLRARRGTGPVPDCWRATTDVADDPRLLIVQHLLLGINAHVNYDLANVVVELVPRGGDLEALHPDFDAVNDVLAETLPLVLGELARVARWTNLVAARGGGRLFDFSLGVARAQAWATAERLQRLDDDQRATEVAALDELVCVLAHLVSRPGAPVSWLAAVGRRFEDHDPTRVTRQLLGPLR